MPDLDLDSLLAPLEGESPCGADLEYDPAFMALEEAGAGKPERQYGDNVIAAEPPDWPVVHEQALALAQRTRDLRVAMWLLRSGARTRGLTAGLQGLKLLCGLVDRYWDQVHPMLDASDGNDPTARLSALSPLVHASAALADLRAAGLTAMRGGLTVRELELAFGRAEPLAGESMPSEGGAVEAVAAAIAQSPELGELMRASEDDVRKLNARIDESVGSAEGVDFKPVLRLLQTVSQAARKAMGAADDGTAADEAAASGGSVPLVRSVPGTITSRDDAVKALDRVCDWIERNEPSNPAPLLIRRAQRLMTKSFLEIIRDLVPAGVDEVEKLAGLGNP
jgi:type VI secretion system protein ImpA